VLSGIATGSASITSATLMPSIRLENLDCIAEPRADWARMKPISASQIPPRTFPATSQSSPSAMKA
jgi:hypothetical protein